MAAKKAKRAKKSKPTNNAKPAKKAGVFQAPKSDGPTVAVRTPNAPDSGGRVNAAKYAAMKKVLLNVVPPHAPGITQKEMMALLGKVAPKDVFPGSTYLWWGKCVQLDLEARGVLVREEAKPLRWHRK